MNWLNGPISDQAVFWLGLKVFWWKRLITLAQLMLGSSIFLALMTAERKQGLHAKLVERRDRSATVVVPPVVSFGTLLKWFVPSILLLAAGLAAVSRLFIVQGASREPMPFFATWLIWVLLLSLAAAPLAQVFLAVSTVVTGIRGVQRYAPPVLEWLFHYERFDRNVTIIVFVLLALVTSLQIYLS